MYSSPLMHVVPIIRIFKGVLLKHPTRHLDRSLTRHWTKVLLVTGLKSYLSLGRSPTYLRYTWCMNATQIYAILVSTSNFNTRHWFLSNLKHNINTHHHSNKHKRTHKVVGTKIWICVCWYAFVSSSFLMYGQQMNTSSSRGKHSFLSELWKRKNSWSLEKGRIKVLWSLVLLQGRIKD